ncbi:hypothetical protein M1843_05385 [Isoptericola sp. 4D.3]|uniref:Uncharacterized protein n=1 Tax=Isoptericola peretonis TaxID=2918523 RepID=A0ABT0J0Z6_9MICO|nr:hypothetical protein [Isoptericola sp. 4D.3]
MNEFLYYDEYRNREAELERALRRQAEVPVAPRGRDREARRAAARRRRAQRRPWGEVGVLARPWPQ